MKSSLYSQLNWRIWPQSKRKPLWFSCGFLYNCLLNGWKTLSHVQIYFTRRNFHTHLSCFNQNAKKKTKLNCIKKHIFSTAQEDIYHNFHWLIADLASSLEVVQVRFAFVGAGCEPCNFYALLFGKSRMLVPFVFKIKMWQVLWTSLFGPSLRFPSKYWWNFKIYFFNRNFVMPLRLAPAYFNSVKLKFMFFSSLLLCILLIFYLTSLWYLVK